MTSLACFPTEDLLTVRVTGGDVVRVTVAGELDAFTAPQLGAALQRATAGEIVVDLAGVTFLYSTGVHVLAAAHRRVVAAGGPAACSESRESDPVSCAPLPVPASAESLAGVRCR